MDTQLKLIKPYDDSWAEKESVHFYPFPQSKTVGVAFDYLSNSYLNVLKKINFKHASQVLLTNSDFIKLINICGSIGLKISTLKFNHELDEEEKQTLDGLLGKNRRNENTDFAEWINLLWRFIRYVEDNYGFVIKEARFMYLSKGKEESIGKISVFNNGVVFVDSAVDIQKIDDLISYIYEG